jgi:hypothetical protein
MWQDELLLLGEDLCVELELELVLMLVLLLEVRVPVLVWGWRLVVLYVVKLLLEWVLALLQESS